MAHKQAARHKSPQVSLHRRIVKQNQKCRTCASRALSTLQPLRCLAPQSARTQSAQWRHRFLLRLPPQWTPARIPRSLSFFPILITGAWSCSSISATNFISLPFSWPSFRLWRKRVGAFARQIVSRTPRAIATPRSCSSFGPKQQCSLYLLLEYCTAKKKKTIRYLYRM